MKKPFSTGDPAGTEGKGGLGLAIVERVAADHGASLRFYRPSTEVFAVQVTFPICGPK